MDGYSIVDCHGTVVQTCGGGEACDPDSVTCDNACAVAERQHRALGCTYYAVDLDGPEDKVNPPPYTVPSGCFSVSVSNAGPYTAHLSLTYRGSSVDLTQYARIRTGALESTAYQPYDNAAGLSPGQVVTLFLAGGSVNVLYEDGVENDIGFPCPIPSLDPNASQDTSGIWDAFQIESDVPVSVYQVDPEGSAFPASALLTATSGWGSDYTALDFGPPQVGISQIYNQFVNVVAASNDTHVVVTSPADIDGGVGVSACPASQACGYDLAAGQHLQLTQASALRGTRIVANAPVGVFVGAEADTIPFAAEETCCWDMLETMLPSTSTASSAYVAASYDRSVTYESTQLWLVQGLVDGTSLTYSPDGRVSGEAPSVVARGSSVVFEAFDPFVVTSQDEAHPFALYALQRSGQLATSLPRHWHADPEIVRLVGTDNYATAATIAIPPYFPLANFVVTRLRQHDGTYHSVVVDCVSLEELFTDIATGVQIASVIVDDSHNSSCLGGPHTFSSDAPFTVTAWAWGGGINNPDNTSISFGMSAAPGLRRIRQPAFIERFFHETR